MLDLLNKLRREAQILNDYNNETFIVVMQHGEIISVTQAL